MQMSQPFLISLKEARRFQFSMRVVHIARSDCQGGAARSAFRLHQGLRSLGHKSVMLVQEKYSQDGDVHVTPTREADEKAMQRLRWIENRAIRQNRSELSSTFFSLNEPGWELSAHPDIAEAEVINLHWMAGFQSPRSLASLLGLGKPVVWTLHDQRPFTGGCHFTAGCSRFENDCVDCPQLRLDDAHLPAAQLTDTEQYLGKTSVALACPSEWMAAQAERSRVFQGLRRKVIPYSVETDLFQPRPKRELRKALALDEDATCLLFGADNANEKRKGFHHLMAALELCQRDAMFADQVRDGRVALICLGHPGNSTSGLNLPIINTGYLTNDELISRWYAAADIFVLPSVEDNLPNTVLESMSSGLPVVAFASGGIPELVRENETGKLAPVGNVAALAAAIISLATDEKLRHRFGTNARAIALKDHQLTTQAKRYLDYYASLAQQGARSSGLSRWSAGRKLNRSPEIRQSSLGAHFSEVYYRLLLRAMAGRHGHGADHLPYRRRKFGRQRLVLAWHCLRMYYRVVNKVRRFGRG
jgi:glycosyltransferase involved in cell wall biosynthesis